MIVPVNLLNELFQKYHDAIDMLYFERVTVRAHNFLPGDRILEDHVNFFLKSGVGEIDVVYTPVMYDFLTGEFPASFRKPIGKLNFLEMDRHLEVLDEINTHSFRKRNISIIGDIYGIDVKEGKRIKILSHEQKLTYQKWNTVKRDLNKNQQFLFRNSEFGIIVFVDLTFQKDREYIERFKKNTDLISILVSRKRDCNESIAPDFIPTEDVISVTDPDKLLKEYIDNNSRMIIIGEDLNDSYKKALLEVKRYDKYVRMIVVPILDHDNLDHFIKQVKLVYNSNRWE